MRSKPTTKKMNTSHTHLTALIERVLGIQASLQNQIHFGADSYDAKSNASVCLGDAMTLLDKVSSSKNPNQLLERAILRLLRGSQYLRGFGCCCSALELLHELKSK